MNFLDRPFAFTDLETSGLRKYKVENGVLVPWNEICEIGLVLANPKTLEILDTFEAKVKLLHQERFSPQALKINGYIEDEWKDAPLLKEALGAYNAKVKDAVIAAWNVTFDWGFLELAYALCDLEPSLDYHRIDLFSHAKDALDLRGWQLEKYNQDEVARFLGLSAEPLPHRGLQGAMQAYTVYKKLRELPFQK